MKKKVFKNKIEKQCENYENVKKRRQEHQILMMKIDKYQLKDYQILYLEKWTKMTCGEILFDSEKDNYKTGIDTGSVFIAVDSGNIYMYYEEFDADGKPMQGRWYPW